MFIEWMTAPLSFRLTGGQFVIFSFERNAYFTFTSLVSIPFPDFIVCLKEIACNLAFNSFSFKKKNYQRWPYLLMFSDTLLFCLVFLAIFCLLPCSISPHAKFTKATIIATKTSRALGLWYIVTWKNLEESQEYCARRNWKFSTAWVPFFITYLLIWTGTRFFLLLFSTVLTSIKSGLSVSSLPLLLP